MPLPARIRSFFRTLFRAGALDRELDDEMSAAVDTLKDRYIAAGMRPEEARRAALLELGGVEQVKEQVRERRVGAAFGTALIDLNYAWRGLVKAPGFTAVIVITLALGIGANSAIFSVVHALLIAPLPYRDADRLIFIWSDMTDAGYPRAPLSGPELADLRARSTTVAGFGAIWANTVALTGEGDPEQLRIGIVTDNFFDVLGAAPALGRTFTRDDAMPGARPAILLGWPLFQRRFGGDASIVGRQILVNDRPTTVIGVMPASFRLLMPPDSSVPETLQAWTAFGARLTLGPRGQQFLRVIGRMKPGVTVDAARTEIDAIASRISREFSEYGSAGRIFTTVPLRQDGVRELRPALLALFAGVGILLAIACGNVASLLIARAVSRTKETALRLALGASRGRMVRQCLIEGLLLAVLGGTAGLALGVVVLRVLLVARPDTLSRIELSRFDAPVVAFTTGVALLWGALFSLAPLIELLKADVAPALQGTARSSAAPLRHRARSALLLAQLTLSVVLLIGAGLLLRAFVRVQGVNPGFRTDGALTFRLAVPLQRYNSPAAVNTFARELQAALTAIPGVTGTGAISHLPYDDLPNWGGGYVPETAVDRSSSPNADYRTVTPGMFETLGVAPIEGRLFTESEDPKTPVVIVDDRLARRMWPGSSPLGQRLLVDPGSSGAPAQKVTVIGVVPHLRLRSLVADLTEQVFFPQRLVLRNPMAYVVQADRDAAALAADVRAAVRSIDPKVPIYDVRPLASYVDNARAARRFTMQLAGAFAVVALILACVGVYGLFAYSVARRRHEFGLRLALGAEAGRLVSTVMREGLRLTAFGSLAGVAAALLISPLLEAQLYGVHATDPLTYGAAIGLLATATAAACWLPARRATAVAPMDALRSE
jgi:predicted permease